MTDYPQPDPSWPCYQLWQQITAAHSALMEALKYMATEECESQNVETDKALNEILDKAHVAVIQAGESLTKEPPREDLN